MTIYIYNNGQVNLNLVQVEVYDSSRSAIDVLFGSSTTKDLLHSGCTATPAQTESPALGTTGSTLTVSQGAVNSVTLTLPTSAMNGACPSSPNWTAGATYYVNILAQYGNNVVYNQVR